MAKKKETANKQAKKSEKPKVKKENNKHSKRYFSAKSIVEEKKLYEPKEAIEQIKKFPKAKFDEAIEAHVRLNVDSSASDQQVRGTTILPEGTGKNKKVAVIASGQKLKEAQNAGADKSGSDDLVAEIEKGKIDFDVLIATPDMMPKVGKLGKVLGTKGLMPSPKSQTVTDEIEKTVKELKSGRIEFRADKNGIVHQVIGRMSFESPKLLRNYEELLNALNKARPQGIKGEYIKSISLSSTMGPSIKLKS